MQGGAIQATLGLNYGEHRIDADYGGKISDTLHFHLGGFYRQGEGPRHVGYDAYKGGQVKFNVTKHFSSGYVRLYGKYLNDHTPSYQAVPVHVNGTDADPTYVDVANISPKRDSLLSPDVSTIRILDGKNRPVDIDARDGVHPIVKAIGLESQFDVAGWSFTERFRFSATSGRIIQNIPIALFPAPVSALVFGGPGATLSYATGPHAGQLIADPATLNGNGLASLSLYVVSKLNSLDNTTNDLRASRVWKIGGGDLTATAGYYHVAQDYNVDKFFPTILSDIRGSGNAALINVTTAQGVATTQDGFTAYNLLPIVANLSSYVTYHVDAPYGSLNYHRGKIAIGGSLRYDTGRARGKQYGADVGPGRVGVAPYDLNGDGVISLPEQTVGVIPLDSPGPVHYTYHYLSYSAGINYRIAEHLAVFARYGRGARGSADKLLFTRAIAADGRLTDPSSGHDGVRQAEIGLKYRHGGVTFNATGFTAKTGEHNLQINSTADGSNNVENIVRSYKAKGLELEGAVHWGVFSLSAGGTYNKAQITNDLSHPDIIGNTPRHQAAFIFEATPAIDLKHVSAGINVVGATSSYAQDTNQLKLPAYQLVNLFVQVRPIDRVQVMFNVNNLIDALAIAESSQAAIPATRDVLIRAYGGRTVSASLRYAF